MLKKGVVRCKTKTNMGEGDVVSLVIIFLPWGKKRKKETYVDRKMTGPDVCLVFEPAVFDGSPYARKINRIYISYIEPSIIGIRDWITLEIERRRVFENIL